MNTPQNTKIVIKVPGKVMLAGEWAVLEPGNRCIVMTVNRYLTGTIQPSRQITINLPDLELPACEFKYDNSALIPPVGHSLPADQRSAYCLAAVKKTLTFLQEIGQPIEPFTLTLTSDISTISLPDGRHIKPGLGSSAATIVATITSILTFHHQDVTSSKGKELIFKLAALTHYQVQGYSGSGFDIAAVTFGTTIMYQRFDAQWLTTKMQTEHRISDIITIPWPGLSITHIPLPQNFIVLVGFVGNSAQTTTLISAVKKFKLHHPARYQLICSEINKIVGLLEQALRNNNTVHLIALIKENRKWLQELSLLSGNILETPVITNLITLAEQEDAAAKFSGAGGGDCGIALCPTQASALLIKKKWQDNNILPLNITIL